jgi:RNA polymerase sigma factor (sigma-70 family)
VGSLLFFERRVDLDPDRGRSTQAYGVDRPTFEELYVEHFDLVRNAIRRRGVRRPAEIEELAQEVFIIVYRRLPEVDFTLGTGKGWIYRIAVNVALNHLRRPRGRLEALMDPAEHETIFSEPGNSEARLADREHLRLLLESTTPERREVYELFEVEGFTLTEVAFALEIPFATADSRLRLARRDMQAANARLQLRKTGGRRAILPFGTGAWLHLREITKRPPGAADRLWERIQSTPPGPGGAEGAMPAKAAKPSWRRRAATLARRAMEPALGAAFGAAVTLVYVHLTQAPARATTVQPAVMLTEEAKPLPAAPTLLNGQTDETSAELSPPYGGADSSKAANPGALLALRKAQAAYVVGDRAAALDALSGFEREFADDPLRISAERLRALVLRPLAANR